jgi:hypothetical protein
VHSARGKNRLGNGDLSQVAWRPLPRTAFSSFPSDFFAIRVFASAFCDRIIYSGVVFMLFLLMQMHLPFYYCDFIPEFSPNINANHKIFAAQKL